MKPGAANRSFSARRAQRVRWQVVGLEATYRTKSSFAGPQVKVEDQLTINVFGEDDETLTEIGQLVREEIEKRQTQEPVLDAK